MTKKLLVCAYCCVSESGVLQVGGEAELGFNLVKQFGRFFQVTVLTHAYNQKAIEKVLQKDPLPNVKFVYIQLPTFLRFLEKFHFFEFHHFHLILVFLKNLVITQNGLPIFQWSKRLFCFKLHEESKKIVKSYTFCSKFL